MRLGSPAAQEGGWHFVPFVSLRQMLAVGIRGCNQLRAVPQKGGRSPITKSGRGTLSNQHREQVEMVP